MKKANVNALLYIGLGGAALYALAKGAGSSSNTSSDQTPGVLSQMAQNLTDLLSTMTGSAQENFTQVMTPIAQAVATQFGIDPLCIMTQAALESNWGRSGLTKKANNLYGYTGDKALDTWLSNHQLAQNTDMPTILAMDLSTAPFIIMQTHEEGPSTPAQYFTRAGDIVSQDGTDYLVYRPFRKYDSWQSSVNDWVSLMQTSRYAAAWADLKAGDQQSFFQDVYAAGYATESDYPTQLASALTQIQNAQGTATA